LPNHVDAQPNKMFEYMSAGIPVIASNFPLWNEIVLGGACGLTVNPDDSYSIAKAIDFFINNPAQAKIMGQNGRLAIQEKYNWEIESDKLFKFYHSLNCL
jgi:glycosyltransferase involved in cell wall biosynthesis